ncbi:phosphohydrolase [Synergistales bacterium]|nr:phosphohydrolase [Synergistales bacterium]
MPDDGFTGLGENSGLRVFKRRISLEEMREYTNSTARVADDVLTERGTILLPRGAELASLISSVDNLERTLQRWGIFSIPIIIENTLDINELESILHKSEVQSATIDPELAYETVEQLSNVYGHISEGACTPEDVSNLAEQGKKLAKEVVDAPQVMLCLGQVKSWDEYTYKHSLNVTLLGGYLAGKMFPGNHEIAEQLSVGGILHDLGKALVPQNVLNKPGKLTDEEFEIMKQHPGFGEQIAIQNGVTDPAVLAVIRGHHERVGGGGYPDGLVGSDIPQAGRIAAVADVFDALTARRVYKEPMASRAAVNIMVGNMGAHFDADVVRTLLLSIGLYPPGTVVELSDGSMGIVVGARDKDLMRPSVSLQIDKMGYKVNKMQIIDLSLSEELFVQRTLSDVGKITSWDKDAK